MQPVEIEPTILDRVLLVMIMVIIMASVFAATAGESLAQFRWCPRC